MASAGPRGLRENLGVDAIATPPPSGPDAVGGRARKVLLVDDEAGILESLKDLFEGALGGVQILTAGSGREALEVLHDERVDLIITDYKMPGMNGLEFLEEAARVAPAVPRILITAFPDLEIAIKAINEADIEHFLTKPLDPAHVVQVVDAVLTQSRADELRHRSFAHSLELMWRRMQG